MEYLTPKEYMEALFPLDNAVVEIGFGNGLFLRWLWENRKEKPIVGVDIANISFKKARSRLKDTGVYLVKSEGNFFLKYMVPPSSVSEVYILFPDPWPKNKKRRLVNEDFVRLLRSRLKKMGTVYLATDDEDYAESIKTVFRGQMLEERWSLPEKTKYMVKWEKMGKKIFSLAFVNHSPSEAPFEKAMSLFEMPLDFSFKAGDIVRDGGCVLKVDAVFSSAKSADRKLYKFVFSEDNFSHTYFALHHGSFIRFLNTWGEVFSPKLKGVFKRLGRESVL